MKNKKKVYIGIVVVLAVMLLGITGYKLLNKKGIEEDPEILRSRTYAQVEEGDEAIDGTEYVTFDAYYLRDLDGDGYAEKLRGTCREVGTQDTLYMDLNVLTNGTLEDAKITINGKNFYFSTAIVKDSVIAQDYVGTNTKDIKLNSLKNGTQKLIFGMVQSGDYTISGFKTAAIGNDTNKYSVTDNTITLTGTHVADDGTRTQISKTVYLTNDWHGTTRTDLYMPSWLKNQEYDIATAIDETNQKLNITFKVNPRELDKELIINKNHIDVELPLINGYAPTNASVKNQNTSTSYDENTRVFTIESISTLNDNGVVTSTVSRNIQYEVTVEYPLDAYTTLGEDAIAVNIPIKAYYEGYNNQSEEFENPYKSNIAEDIVSVVYKNPEGENARVDITVGELVYDDVNKTYRYVISKELPMNLYNQVDTENDEADEYVVRWYLYTGTQAVNVPIKMKETPEEYTDKFLDTDGNYIDMEKYISNTGIYFVNAGGMLGEEGYINVYNDETGELLHTFTKDDWNSYNESHPYRYETPVEHIRVETSNVLQSSYLYVYSVKEIDDVLLTADYTEENFEKLNEIYSYLTGYMIVDGQDNKLDNDINYANYEMPYSVATISTDPNYVSNQETKKGVKININAQTQRFNTKKWSNGEFLIKYPTEIIDVNVNSVTSNDSNVTITGVDIYEENGNIYTKIYTSNDIESNLSLIIDVDLTADPREATVTRNIELYYYNPVCHNYYEENRTEDIYDVNGNENIQEYVGYTTSSLNIIAPSNLLTSQTATNFDDNNSVAVAPQEATVDKVDGTKTATVNVNVTNNYSNTISEVKIVGKIPFEGNTYQLNGADLESEFDTQIVGQIQIPEEIKPYATVYYSEKEKVTEDIEATKNGWTTTPEDMSKVKSYLIDLGDFVMPVENTYTFSYNIQIPSGLDYNQISYSDHAVYYCLDTDQGKLKTQTEPNKLGFRIAEKYDLEISKYQTNTDKIVSGVVFSAQEVGQEETKTAVTYSSGIATIRNLYVEREYVIKEIRTNDNYVLNEQETRIIGHVVDGKLQIEVLEGEFKDTPVIEEVENNNTKVKVELENEVKYNFELSKTLTGTSEAIQGIRFELRNENTGDTRRYTTNSEGKLTIKLLEPNVQYTLTEIESKGHYLKEPVSFMMVIGTDRNLKFNVLAGDLDTLPQIDTTGEVPVVRTGLANEKIPTYSLRITKKETDTETTITGAQFKLIGENKEDNILYTTGEDGVVQIDNLYQYVEGKDVTGEYTLQEIYPTEGYILNETPVEFRAQKDATGNLKLEIISGTIRENVDEIQVDNTNSDNPIISITIDNDPIFTLTKVDAETGEPLEGVEFEITDLEGNKVVDANGNAVDKVYTDSNGKIRLSLTEGLYKATETQPLEGYEVPEVYTGVGIGESKEAEYSSQYTLKWTKNALYSYQACKIVDDGIVAVSWDGVISKFDFEGNILWQYIENLYYNDLKVTNEGIFVCGDSGKIEKISNDGELIWARIDENTTFESLTLTDNGLVAVGQLGKAVSYDLDGNLNWKNSQNQYTYKSVTSVPGGAIAVSSSNGNVVKFDLEGNIVWENTDNSYSYRAITTVDNAVIAVGSGGEVTKFDFNGNILWNYDPIINFYGSYCDIATIGDSVIGLHANGVFEKYDFNNNLEWINTDIRESLTSSNIRNGIDAKERKLVICAHNGSIFYFENQLINPEIPESQNIIVENTRKEYNITTEVNGVGGIISGQDEDPYEIVKHGENSIKDIIATPLDGYKVQNITINGVPIDFVENLDGTVKLDKFISMTEDKEVIISFAKENSSLIINKVDSTNNDPLAGATFNIKQLETREEPAIEQIAGKIVANNDTYNFVDNENGGYESNNQGVASTVANSYMPLDLTNYIGKYTLIVNANVSSESNYDCGYATITEDTTAPAYNSSTGRFIYISGTSSSVSNPKDYTTILEGGKMYYLHFGYYKDTSTDSGNDKFTINSINITLNQDDFVDTDITTNSSGEAIIELSDGRYQITEVQAPEEYTLNSEPIIYDFVSGQENILTIENQPESNIIVHHYIKDTTTPVAPDEYIKDDLGKEYSTSPKTDLEEYELVKNEDGSYKIPSNASGTFKEETQVVTYYYEKKPLQLIVHHYLDGTEDSVAPDEISEGQQGQEYTTNPVEYPELDEKYELVQEKYPLNANGTLEEQVTEVTYYYKVKEYEITTEVDGVGGTISGQNEDPYETVLHEEDSVKDIVIIPDERYEIESITINGEEQELPFDRFSEYTLDKFTNMTEDKHIVVRFEPIKGNIYVDKIWEDNSDEAGKRPKEIEIQLYNGSTLVSSLKMNEEDNGGQLAPVSLEENTQVTNGWGARFENVPMYDENGNPIEYTVVEKEVNTNDLYFYETNIEQTGGDVFTITNTFKVPEETIDIEVTKKWEDENNVNGLRPQEIKLQVKNGEDIVQEQTINVESGNEQSYTFTGLDKYDELGNEIRYTVDEVEVNTDGLKFYSKQIDNETHTITNTFTVPDEKTSIDVTKKWEDNSNVNETRPKQITIQIKNGEEIVQSNTVDVTEEDEKVYTFTDLAKYDKNGQEIEYTVDEIEVNKDELIGYEKSIEGNVITNTLKSHKITTEVNGEGGTISGQNEDPYEEVRHKGDSVKDIIITPEEGYEIAKITINDVEQELPENVKEEYTLDKFIEVTEDKHVVVEFKKIEYKITTEVDGVGGQISGEGETPYETVEHGENSIKDIICTPEYGYKIGSITVNGETIEFTPNEEDKYTLDKFINMTEDKHIVVKYEKKDTSIVVKHVDEEGNNLIEPETIEGKVGDSYNTEEKEFEEYEIKTIPENADGEMEEEQIEVIYVYSKVKGKVTITKVDKEDTSKLLEGATYKIEKLDDEGNVDETFISQEKTTGEDGEVEFSELTVGKYKITEIKAPEGYELSKSNIEVEITKAEREVDLTATNLLKLELPETGSIGLAIFTVAGITVMSVAFILNKKQKVQE